MLSRFGFFPTTYIQAAVLRPRATLNSLFPFLMVPHETKKNAGSRIADGKNFSVDPLSHRISLIKGFGGNFPPLLLHPRLSFSPKMLLPLEKLYYFNLH